MADLDPRAHDSADSADAASGYRYEAPEQRYLRRSRNLSVFVAVTAVLALAVVLGMGFMVLFVLHAITSGP